MSSSDGNSFNEKLGLLESIIQQGIEKLLAEAASKKYLEAPFGRKPEPTPLISEEFWEVVSPPGHTHDSVSLTCS
jgi:hypothetical protein